MTRAARYLTAAATATLVVTAGSSSPAATALSDPMGVYCILDKVVLEPATEEPLRAQLWGVCAVANTNDWYFQPVARGYFYYSIPQGQDTVVLREWNDLKTAAGTGEAVGFGRRYRSVGRFRPTTEKAASPDVYPLNMGVVRITAQSRVPPEVREVVAQLKAAHGKKGL